jgi:autotransporter-associated beta strand protein
VTILDGTLSVAAAAGALGDGPVFLSGGTLNYTGAAAGGTYTLDNDLTVTADSAINLRGGTGGSGQTPGREFKFTTNNFSGTGGTLTLRNDSNSNEPILANGGPVLDPVLFTVTFTGEFDFDRPVVIANHLPIPGHPEFDIITTQRTTVLNAANTSGTQEWSGVISGNGGVVRNGAAGSTAILSGNNTYTGNTTIDAGTLTLTNPFLADTADVLFVTTGAGSPVLNLTHGLEDTIDQLFIDGSPVATGTWGSTASGATNTNDTLFSGMGRLLVTAMGSSPGAVPEPGSFMLAMMTVYALGGIRRRRCSL